MSLIIDDLVPSKQIKFDDLPTFRPGYEHVKCECGGTIGAYDRENFSCDKCGRRFEPYILNYESLLINDVTGWIFPVNYKTEVAN